MNVEKLLLLGLVLLTLSSIGSLYSLFILTEITVGGVYSIGNFIVTIPMISNVYFVDTVRFLFLVLWVMSVLITFISSVVLIKFK